MTLEEATKIAPVASALFACVAAFIAAVSAAIACLQIALARRTAVIQVLQTFDKAASDREASLSLAADEVTKDHAFNELMNFLELYAGICNRKLVTGLARQLVQDRLIDSVVVIERAKAWHQAIDDAVFHETTFVELRTFLRRNRKEFDKRRVAAQKRAALIKLRNEATRGSTGL